MPCWQLESAESLESLALRPRQHHTDRGFGDVAWPELVTQSRMSLRLGCVNGSLGFPLPWDSVASIKTIAVDRTTTIVYRARVLSSNCVVLASLLIGVE